MDLQFFGGRGGGSGRKNKRASILQPAPELDKIKPESQYMDILKMKFNTMLRTYQQNLSETVTENDLLAIEDKVREMLSSNEVHIGIRFHAEDLKAILNDGRFKSQFETGKSGGSYDPAFRRKAEKEQMGYKKSTLKQDRPIYGMLFEGKDTSKISPTQFGGVHYGDVVAILKPSVKTHSTVTFEDSLSVHGGVCTSPLLKPSRYSIPTSYKTFHNFYESSKSGGKMQLSKVITNNISGYAEVQIHNRQATVSNIERLIFPKWFSKDDIPVDFLRKQGIKWNTEK